MTRLAAYVLVAAAFGWGATKIAPHPDVGAMLMLASVLLLWEAK